MSRLADMMSRVRKLKNDVGLQSLLDAAYEILGNPLLMFNTEYKLLAYVDVITDDPVWNEIVTHGTFCKETQKLFESEGFIEDLANAPRSAFMSSEKLKYDRIAGKLFNINNSYVSNLVVVACDKPFEEHDTVVFEAVCKLITREISRSGFYQEYEQTHQEAIIRNLIDGNYDMKLEIAQVGIIYDSLKSNLYIAAADISLCDPEYTRTAYFRDILKQTEPAFKYAVYSDYIVIIISTNDDTLNVKKELDKLIRVFEQNNIYAGISGRFENLFELKKYYGEALGAMRYTLECKCSQRIFPYNANSVEVMGQIEALGDGLGIQYYLNKGAEIFGNPLLFHDMEPNLLGYTENMEITDPIWQELITYGTGSDKTVELFRTEGWIDIMDSTRGGALLVSDKCKYDRISWRIYNNDNIRFGCTSIVNTAKPFSEDELVLFGIFSRKFSDEVKKIELYNDIGQVYSETVINRLISGKIDDYTFFSEDIGNLYDDFMENLYLAVIDISRCNSGRINLAYFRDIFNKPGTMNRYAIYGDYIIIIISTGSVPPVAADKFNKSGGLREFAGINKVFEQNNIYAGISSRFDDIYELRKYYMEAADALNSGVENKGEDDERRIFRYGGSDYS